MKSLHYLISFLLIFTIVVIIFTSTHKKEEAENNNLSNDINQNKSIDNYGDDHIQIPPNRSMDDLKNVTTRSTVLTAVNNFKGTGTANLKTDGMDIFIHSIKAGLPDPDDQHFYEGWLTGGVATDGFISTGKMIKEGDYYVLQYETDEVYEQLLSYDTIIITLESKSLGLDNNPETHVLEGNFN